ncbi:MAG: hypothetical protein NZ928_02730 [Endomicrobia bacterium]|nr:hypothetical protein [Endomicrobiia bacterium]MDW8055906.1 hypothetical protein [Elusimicrobiota bacterium]
MRINNFLKISVIIFSLLLFTKNAYVGPPPGVGVGSSINRFSSSTEKNTKILFSVGTYSPSLNLLNNDLKYYGIPTLDSNNIYTFGIGSNKNNLIFFFSYWSAATRTLYFRENLAFYILGFDMNIWRISKLFLEPYNKIFNLDLKFIARDIFATLRDENITTSYYISCTAITMDFGTGMEFEYFPMRENKFFSFSLGFDYILFNIPILSFEVWDTNIPGYSVGDKYKDHTGKNISAETQGTIFKLGVNLYF